jgi:hypothetical protein
MENNGNVIEGLILIAFGIPAIIKFRELGTRSIEGQKKLSRIMLDPLNPPKSDTNSSIKVAQTMCLVVGILFIFFGLTMIFGLAG